MDDNTFAGVVVFIAIVLAINKFLENYDYQKTISNFNFYLTNFIILSSIILTLFFISKKILCLRSKNIKIKNLPKSKINQTTKKQSKVTKQCTTKKQLSKSAKVIKPKIYENKELSNEKTNKPFSQSPIALARAEKKAVNINVDYDIKFHKFKNLNEHEVRYLLRHGFKLESFLNPFTKNKEKFIFKTNGNEGVSHFLLTNLIADFLKEKVDNLKTFETIKPDIVFELNQENFAIEVETGKNLRHSRKNLLKKVNLLNKNYDNWFFVVTDQNIALKYKKLGETIDKRSLRNKLNKLLNSVSQFY